MHLSTDYAIRIILYLAQCETQVISAQMLARQLGITYPYFMKVATALKRAGLVESVMGYSGGYRLAQPSSDITLYDIICVIQGPICINGCLKADGQCSRYGTQSAQCPVHSVLKHFQEEVISRFKGQTIADICAMHAGPPADLCQEGG